MGEGEKHGTAISWTHHEGFRGETWNPTTGCSKVSPGCANCYAETLTLRFAGTWGVPALPWTPANAAQNVILHPDRLEQPLRWAKPRSVFVNSMSDVFHELIPVEFIARIFAIMVLTPRHRYMILTKRPERMRDVLAGIYPSAHRGGERTGRTFRDIVLWELMQVCASNPYAARAARALQALWPLPNVWLGVSIEGRRFVNRADILRQTPAAARFISAEPLLGPLVNLERPTYICECGQGNPAVHECCCVCGDDVPGCSCELWLDGIDWLLVGGESGGPMRRRLVDEHDRPREDRIGWVRDLRDAAYRAGTAFFLKQWGGQRPTSGGHLLDGVEYHEMPDARPRVSI